MMTQALSLALPDALPELVTAEFSVAAVDPGINPDVCNKRPAALRAFSPQRTLLYVRGSTNRASTAFDLKIAGCSWTDFSAARGIDHLNLLGWSCGTTQMATYAARYPPQLGLALFPLLVNAPYKRLVMLAEGTPPSCSKRTSLISSTRCSSSSRNSAWITQ